MANKNKVKYGLKNVHYALLTLNPDNSGSFGTPVPIPGAVSLSMEQQAERSVFRADNTDYYVGNSSSSYQGDLTIALIPDSFKRDVLGYLTDANGVLYERANPPTVHFALLFQFEGDAKATRRVLYNNTVTPPGEAGETTGEGAIEPNTEVLNLLATSLYFPELEVDGQQGVDLVKASTNPDTDNAAYNSWFNTVKVPTSLNASVYRVEQSLTHVNASSQASIVAAGAAYSLTLTPEQGYTLGAVIVTMGGEDVTATAYSNGAVTIDEVTGDIRITAVANAT